MSKPVEGRVEEGGEDEWVRYDSLAEAAQILNLDQGNISRCCGKTTKRGKPMTAGKYEFRHAEPTEEDPTGEEWKDVVLKDVVLEDVMEEDEDEEDEDEEDVMEEEEEEGVY